MTIQEIKELIEVANESGIAELEVQRGENRVRIRRSIGGPQTQEIVFSAGPTMPATHAAPHVSTAFPITAAPAPLAAESDSTLVKSPIVGTYYDAPSPGSAPFVKVGDQVQPGQILCIIESMKLMNEIEAEISGTVVSKLVENGRPVEYGEALFAVQPK
ncbi:MAG: acetyl-CoA carboxylase biotin carboxyl carrier protein [Bryobacteraceae bacterium]